MNVTGQPVDYANIGFTHSVTTRTFTRCGNMACPAASPDRCVQLNAGWNKKSFIPGLPGYDTPDSATDYLNVNAHLTHPNNKHFSAAAMRPTST